MYEGIVGDAVVDNSTTHTRARTHTRTHTRKQNRRNLQPALDSEWSYLP
jgi:hypothetical protein